MSIIKFYSTSPSLIFVQQILRKIFAVPDPGLTTYDDNNLRKVKVKITQSCLTLCNPLDCTVHGILQARIQEWVAFPFSRGSSQHRDQTVVSCIAGRLFTNWAIREANLRKVLSILLLPYKSHQYNEKASITQVTTWQDFNAKDSVFKLRILISQKESLREKKEKLASKHYLLGTTI